MDKQITKKKLVRSNIITALITAILLTSVYFVFLKPQNNVQVIENTEPTNETKEETKKEDSSNQEPTKEEIKDSLDEEDTVPEIKYIYRDVEKEVIVEKETSRPLNPTDAIITYRDSLGNTKTLNLPKNTTINFSAGEHGLYNSVPSPITLSSKQELDITTTSYDPDSIEVNYIFKGFSYSGDTFTAMYEKASNIINYEIKRVDKAIIKNNIAYAKLDYIESTGTQYINTGLTMQQNDVVNRVIELANTNLSQNDKTIFGSTIGNTRGGYIYYIASNNQYRFAMGSGDGLAFNYNGTDKFKIELETNGNVISCKFNDGTPATYTNTASRFTNYSEYLFSGRQGASANWQMSMKCYKYQVKVNDELKLDLIPVERISDGILGMLDLVNGDFYVNSGTGVFCGDKANISTDLSAGKIYASVSGSSIALTALPNEGYSFVCWNDGTISPNKNINVGDTDIYSAIFKAN